jgi:hypothetical protein
MVTANTFNAYMCLKTHVSSSSLTYTDTTCWKLMTNMPPIYTPFIMAENSDVNFSQTNQLLVRNPDNSVNAGLGGGDYPFWAGGATPSTATFRVKKDGSARMKGTLQLSTSFSGNYSDVNLFWIPKVTTDLDISMGTETEDVGKVCRLYNSNPIGGNKVTVQLQTWGWTASGSATFVKDNEVAVIMPQEIIELTCFAVPPTEYFDSTYAYAARWTITNRFGTDNWKDNGDHGVNGRFPRIWAIGRVVGTSSGATISGKYYDGTSLSGFFTVTRQEEGKYRITFPQAMTNSYVVMATGVNWTDGGGPSKPSVMTIASTYFDMLVSDDDSLNDGSFDFVIFAPHWDSVAIKSNS